MKRRAVVFGVFVAVGALLGACDSGATQTPCAPGTTRVDGECLAEVADPVCGGKCDGAPDASDLPAPVDAATPTPDGAAKPEPQDAGKSDASELALDASSEVADASLNPLDGATLPACEARPLSGSCLLSNGLCKSYHALSGEPLDIVQSTCSGEGGAFHAYACPTGYAYCAGSDGAETYVRTWKRTVECGASERRCEADGPAEPIADASTIDDAGSFSDAGLGEDAGLPALTCERPTSLGACRLATQCVEVYNPERLAAVRTACTGTFSENAPCEAGLYYCVSPKDTHISVRFLREQLVTPCAADMLECISK